MTPAARYDFDPPAPGPGRAPGLRQPARRARPGSARRSPLGALLLCCAAAWAGPAAGQTPAPDAAWRTLRTEHFRVTFPRGHETVAWEAARHAEEVHAILAAELVEPPAGTIDLVLVDDVDYANGRATPFNSNRIVVAVRPATAIHGLAYTRAWLRLVIAHELVHTFHLDDAGPVGGALRAVFGRVPMLWPLFPNVGTPAWSVEGLATHYETRLTGAGRIAGSFHDMVIRTAALEDAIPDLGDVQSPSPAWPGGQRAYVYGAALMRWIADAYGPDAHHRILDAAGGAVLPTFLFFDGVADEATGRGFEALYDAWRAAASDSAARVGERERAAGLTRTVPVAGRGPYAAAPRVSPDGRRLAFAAHDFRSDAATRIVELPGPADTPGSDAPVRAVIRRNQFGAILGPAAWLTDGSGVVFGQLEFHGPYRVLGDLWLRTMDGRERRLTHGLRLSQPDVAPDGRRVAAVQTHGGGVRLVVYDLEAGTTRVLAGAGPGEAFDRPRWDPAGRRVAAGLFRDGRVDLVVVDAGTGAVSEITSDDALDLAPAWSPDGRWLLWWSDRSGIPNIYAVPADPSGGEAAGPDAVAPRQVTRVLTGAFDPEVSSDGRYLYMAVYHHDGWRIERAPFDPAGWTAAPPSIMAYGDGLLPASDTATRSVGAARGGPEADSAFGPYSPLPTLRPYYWLPTWNSLTSGPQDLQFVGAYSSGVDVVGRHAWEASAAVDPGTLRWEGDARWSWRGLGNPTVSVWARREWTSAGTIAYADGSSESVYLREDRASLGALLLRPRWRSSAWLRVTGDVRTRRYEAHETGTGELARLGVDLPALPTLVGASAGPGFSTARSHPYSISLEDGVTASAGAGRWWTAEGDRAYDELLGRAAAYASFPAWGFADHVVAARFSGLYRQGDHAGTTSIGGVPGSGPTVFLLDPGGRFLPVRGFDAGALRGTRAWTASAEYRFPIHLAGRTGRTPGPGVLGLSLSTVAGAIFADAGNAWCTAEEAPDLPCDVAGDPLASAGAELQLDLGILHGQPLRLRLGLAVPVRGGGDHDPRFYAALGAAF